MREFHSTDTNSGDTVDVKHVSDMRIEQPVPIAKGKATLQFLDDVINTHARKRTVQEKHGVQNTQSKEVARKRIRTKMLYRSSELLRLSYLIEQKVVRLREQSLFILEDLSKCTHDSHGEGSGLACE